MIIEIKKINFFSNYYYLKHILLPGSSVRLVSKTPFGGPIQIKLNHSYLAIRKEDAILIKVKY